MSGEWGERRRGLKILWCVYIVYWYIEKRSTGHVFTLRFNLRLNGYALLFFIAKVLLTLSPKKKKKSTGRVGRSSTPKQVNTIVSI